MGEAKKRGNEEERVAAAKEKALGSNPFEVAYEAIFGVVKAVYEQKGGINHELIGIEFKDGKVSGVNVLLVKDEAAIDRIPLNIQKMLLRWPLVAHVMEAWALPPGGVSAGEHPDRKDVIAITLHSRYGAMLASCEVNEKLRTVQKAELLALDQLGGRLGRTFETRN